MMDTNPDRKAMRTLLRHQPRDRRLLCCPAHAHFFYAPLCGFNNLETQSVFFDDFSGLRDSAGGRADEPADGGGVSGVDAQLKEMLKAIDIDIAAHQVDAVA